MSFVVTVLIYVGFQVILTLGLNVQFGLTGLLNLAYIVFYAVGAYTTSVFMLPRPAGQVAYVLGWNWPFPPALLLGILAAGAAAVLLGLVVLNPKLRPEYLGIATLVASFAIVDAVSNYTPLVNGYQGLIDIPQPFGSQLSPNVYAYLFLLLVAAFAVAAFLVVERIRRSPLGRTLRAVREDETAARAFGTNLYAAKLKVFVLGAMIAGVAGGLTAVYVSAFTTSGWTVGETIVALTCIFIGGNGNNWGALAGSFLVVAVVNQGLEVLLPMMPTFANDPTFIPILQVILINLLLLVALRWRPRGIFPERVIKLPAWAQPGAPAPEQPPVPGQGAA